MDYVYVDLKPPEWGCRCWESLALRRASYILCYSRVLIYYTTHLLSLPPRSFGRTDEAWLGLRDKIHIHHRSDVSRKKAT